MRFLNLKVTKYTRGNEWLNQEEDGDDEDDDDDDDDDDANDEKENNVDGYDNLIDTAPKDVLNTEMTLCTKPSTPKQVHRNRVLTLQTDDFSLIHNIHQHGITSRMSREKYYDKPKDIQL